MTRLAVVLLVAGALLRCSGPADPAPFEPCDYDGYRKITFTSTGDLVADQMFDENSQLQMYFTFNRDTNGYIDTVVVHDPAGADIGCIASTLDPLGNPLVDAFLDQDGVVFAYEEYTYDSSGDLVSSVYCSADSTPVNSYRYIYDGLGRLYITEKYDETNSLVEKVTNERDYHGSLASAEVTDASGTRLGYREYTYSYADYSMTVTYYDCSGGAAKRAQRSGFRRDSLRIMRGRAVALW